MKVVCLIVALSVLCLLGCGAGSGLPSSSAVVLDLAPMQSIIPAGGTVTLQASVSGFTQPPYLSWWMQEQHDPPTACADTCAAQG